MEESSGAAGQDREQLELLSLFHYVAAGIVALLTLVPFVQLAVGLTMAAQQLRRPRPEDFLLVALGWLFVSIAALAIACGLGYAACLAVAGRSLARRERHTFCLVVAVVSCFLVPFGTLLGVFTLLVLIRPSVRELFAAPPP